MCDLAHAHGAYVYADIIQAAGAVPLDVRASGVDFAACSTFKWLMGDFGLGLLLRPRRAARAGDASARSGATIQRPTHGGALPAVRSEASQRRSHGRCGTTRRATSRSAAWRQRRAAVGASLGYIQRARRREHPGASPADASTSCAGGVPRLGFNPQTPPETHVADRDVRAQGWRRPIQRKLQAANVNVRVSRHWMRMSPSVYNDMQDVERLLEALT